MNKKKVKIPNINCQHCAATIKRELSEIGRVEYIDVDVETKTVTVRWSNITSWEKIKSNLSEIGYPPQE